MMPALIWIVVFLISLVIILPSFATSPTGVIGSFAEFFRSDDYNALHQFGANYYFETFIFRSTPLHFIALITLFFYLAMLIPKKNKQSGLNTEHLLIMVSYALIFLLAMTIGAKKGDRYVFTQLSRLRCSRRNDIRLALEP